MHSLKHTMQQAKPYLEKFSLQLFEFQNIFYKNVHFLLHYIRYKVVTQSVLNLICPSGLATVSALCSTQQSSLQLLCSSL